MGILNHIDQCSDWLELSIKKIRRNWSKRKTLSGSQGIISLEGDENEDEIPEIPEIPRISWPHGSAYSPSSLVIPDLTDIECKSATYPPPERLLLPATETQTRCLNAWRRTYSPPKERDSHLLNLPLDLLLIVVSELPDASVVSLALTCKSLLSRFSASSIFCKVRLPSEQPRTFRDLEMSKPEVYQPARWEFLHFLEKDSRGAWYLCSECFTLHPPKMFLSWMMSPLKSCSQFGKASSRTCRGWRQPLCSISHYASAPTGIVDLCPCIKLTIGKKRQIIARLREGKKFHADGRPAADFWWHECRQIYGNVQMELRIGLFLYDGTKAIDPARPGAYGTWIFNWTPIKGALGVLLEYRLTFPLQSAEQSPRLLCPHRNLLKSIRRLSKCRQAQITPGKFCETCRKYQFCPHCRTKVHDLRKLDNIDTYKNYGWILRAAGRFDESSATTIGSLGLLSALRRNMVDMKLVTCSFRVEKCLDGNIWPAHTVFPYVRLHIPVDGYSPAPFWQLPCPDRTRDVYY